jgi:hypothetical protein
MAYWNTGEWCSALANEGVPEALLRYTIVVRHAVWKCFKYAARANPPDIRKALVTALSAITRIGSQIHTRPIALGKWRRACGFGNASIAVAKLPGAYSSSQGNRR